MDAVSRINSKYNFIDIPTRKLNRLKRRVPKTGKFYCGCDRGYMGETERCRACGGIAAPFKMHRRELP